MNVHNQPEKLPKKILVGGLHLGGDGYPNAQQTLHILEEHLHLHTVECGAWLPASMHLWRLRSAALPGKVLTLGRLLLGNLLSVCRVLGSQGRERAPVYVPYPALFFLWWASWIPARWRPRCLADAYISVWDAMYRDRSGGAASLSGRLLKAFESRALRAAAVVLVDTTANKQMVEEEFKVEARRIRALPLAIDEELFAERTAAGVTGKKPTITVLFVGTLVPLHGIATILEAVRMLLPDPRFRFRFLGDGQMGEVVEKLSEEFDPERFVWIRRWLDLPDIAAEIDKADICLGVFGGAGKAARVLPFKIYMYLASGKPVVTQDSLSLPESTPWPPMTTVNAASAAEVANAIVQLANDHNRRQELARAARVYYEEHLSHARITREWQNLLQTF